MSKPDYIDAVCPFTVLEFELPTWWAGPLINNDWSCEGMTFEDRVQILYWQRTHGLCCASDMSEQESRIGYSVFCWLIPAA